MTLGAVASDIAGRIRELRDVTGLTQDGLGDLAGVNGHQISAWETSRAVPPRRRLSKLCERQDWPIAMFAEGGPRPKTCVNGPRSPSNERARRQGYQTVYARAIAEVYVHMEAGTEMSTQRVMYWLNAILAAFTRPDEGEDSGQVQANGGQ